MDLSEDLSESQYSSVNKNIRFKTTMLISDLCSYSDLYIVIKGTITVEGTNDANRRNKSLTLKNNAPFRSCISKINNAFIEITNKTKIITIKLFIYK